MVLLLTVLQSIKRRKGIDKVLLTIDEIEPVLCVEHVRDILHTREV